MASKMEKRLTMVSGGHLPSNKLLEALSSRPFVHQVDVVFPFNPKLQTAFSELETEFHTSFGPISEIYEALRAYIQESDPASGVYVASTGKFLPDAWSCAGGSFNLSAGKETYEALGLPGTKISSKMSGAPEQHPISIPLTRRSDYVRNHDFILNTFARWDRSRESSGEGQWEFAFHISKPDSGAGPLSCSRAQCHQVKPAIRRLANVRIPLATLSPRPQPHSVSTGPSVCHAPTRSNDVSKEAGLEDDDALQDWNEEISSLFEWVGMVSIGAQRLQANDRVDPYVAVYSAPAPSTVGDVVHVRWCGFLNPRFVQKILDTATTLLPERAPTASGSPLIALTIHGSTEAPVPMPYRLPRSDGEDTASIILVPGSSPNEDNTGGQWAMLETIGKWDSRFG
ncbi:ribonuclease P 40kDa subunit-domain-containing protein [Gloeopeniophorella convolvens]|nr:ribonuclease P 40kDa subunit-domain-containing protein [Gloeopeniophorella convolvens]